MQLLARANRHVTVRTAAKDDNAGSWGLTDAAMLAVSKTLRPLKPPRWDAMSCHQAFISGSFRAGDFATWNVYLLLIIIIILHSVRLPLPTIRPIDTIRLAGTIIRAGPFLL